MKSDYKPSVEQAEIAVETNLSKFSNAVNHLEDKIIEGKAKVEKVRAVANRPKKVLNSIQDKAHQLSTQAHLISDTVTDKAQPILSQGKDYGFQFWKKFEANPFPFIAGAAALFGAMVYLMADASGEDDEESLWGW